MLKYQFYKREIAQFTTNKMGKNPINSEILGQNFGEESVKM